MLGISTSSFYGRLSTEDAIYKISEMGVGCAEVFLNSFSEYKDGFIKMVSERLCDSGLTFNSVHTLPTQFEPQLFAVTDRQKIDALDFLKGVLDGASKAGCKIYVMHGKPYFKKNVDKETLNMDLITERLSELCNVAKEYDMCIGLENVHWAMCNNIEFIEEIKEQVPDLRFTLDIKQAHLSMLSWEKYLSAFGSRLVNIHICDYSERKTCIPGKGEMDFKCFYDKVKSSGYKGNVILEVYEGDYRDFDELQECVSFCKGIFRGW